MSTKKEMLANVEYVGQPQLIANNTVQYTRPNGDVCFRLHRTDVVVKRLDGSLRLSTGGWETSTTRDRINSYADGVAVFQRKHVMYICKRGDFDNAIPFEDGMIIGPDREVRSGREVAPLPCGAAAMGLERVA